MAKMQDGFEPRKAFARMRHDRRRAGRFPAWSKAILWAAGTVALIVFLGTSGWLLAVGGQSAGTSQDSPSAAITPTTPLSGTPPASTAGLTSVARPAPGALDLNPPDGYTFDGDGLTSADGTLTLGNDCTISGVAFSGGRLGVQIRGSGNTIRDCTFGPYFRAALILWAGNDNVVDGCTFNGVAGSGANIQVIGGKRNRITNNVIHGGVTAIAFLYSRDSNGGGRASLIEDNVVAGNTCAGFSEEGITFDVYGNRPDSVATLEYDRVHASGGSSVTLSPLPFPAYLGYDMVFLSGALSGQTRSIVGQLGSTFALSGPVDGVTADDQVVIGATFKRNRVSGNAVIGGIMGILLYGMAFENEVENNIVFGSGVKVESIDNLVVASGSATGAFGRAPCGYNMVRSNTVTNADVSLEYYAIPRMNGHVNTYTAYTSVGNNVIGNRCARVNANRQYCCISRNTGTANYWNVVLSPRALLRP
jgi:hypothetical protein